MQALSYTEAVHRLYLQARKGTAAMERHIRPYLEQRTAEEHRAAQRRRFARNQVLGLVLLAACVLVWWLMHSNPRWIFPPGWWRL